ncbi:MAG: type II secretion system F family protein [archaeon]
MKEESYLRELKELLSKETKIIKEIISISQGIGNIPDTTERNMVESQIVSLKNKLKKTIEDISIILEDMLTVRPLPLIGIQIPVTKSIAPSKQKKPESTLVQAPEKIHKTRHKIVDVEITDLEKVTLKRIKKKEKKPPKRKAKKASKYVKTANDVFGGFSQSLAKQKVFITLKRDLIKANMKFVTTSYISVMLLTTLISFIAGLFIFLFFLFFNLGIEMPIITSITESLGARFVKTFWILFAMPLATFITMYIYPSVEKSYIKNKIDQELPFATINMAAISGSMVEPSKMFSIIALTGEYPFLQKEFTKLINEINVYGYDLVTALRNVAFNSPSMKLTELLNGIATTINSGGDLTDFFEKRGQTLLFDYKIEREKYTKTAETFMDIYISLVIAAPMILMLLLMMMRVSGLGISLSTSMITLVMILGVSMVNILFLTFLQLKQTSN